jgi:hypothetical protein
MNNISLFLHGKYFATKHAVLLSIISTHITYKDILKYAILYPLYLIRLIYYYILSKQQYTALLSAIQSEQQFVDMLKNYNFQLHNNEFVFDCITQVPAELIDSIEHVDSHQIITSYIIHDMNAIESVLINHNFLDSLMLRHLHIRNNVVLSTLIPIELPNFVRLRHIFVQTTLAAISIYTIIYFAINTILHFIV